MLDSNVPSGYGYAEIPLDTAERKHLKSIQIHQSGEALNVDLEFEDNSMLEMIFEMGFQASVKLLDYEDGNYQVRKKIKLRHMPA